MSVSKATKDARTRDFVEITGSSVTDASRFLKLTSWRLESALDAFYSDPTAVRAASARREQGSSSNNTTKNLEKMWECYQDPEQPDEIGIDGTIQYCQDLGVEPEDVVMLAVAWLTNAPTMGKFAKSGWINGWRTLRKDTIELQRHHIERLRLDMEDAEKFRKIYNYTFDYARSEGQKSMQYETASALWNLLIPLDPSSSFPQAHLDWWYEFLVERGSRAVSKDTWNLFLEFVRSIDLAFSQYDEQAAWPSLIDDYVQYARSRITSAAAEMQAS